MKVRVLSSIVGVALFAAIVILSLNFSIAWNISIAAMVTIAVFEMLKGTKCVKSNLVLTVSVLFAVLMQFICFFENPVLIMSGAAFVYLLLLFLICMAGKIKVFELAFSFMGTIMISGLFLSLVFIKDKYGFAGVVFSVCTAWLTDIFALFSGMLFGKHKLAPVISPKKTVEGAIGGLICCVGICMAVANVYAYVINDGTVIDNIHCIEVVAICSVVSMIGDLCFSLVKRHFGIKDYGKIMPGHGGVLDRFDSVLFAAPAFLLLGYFLPVIA